jgi:TonB family protein
MGGLQGTAMGDAGGAGGLGSRGTGAGGGGTGLGIGGLGGGHGRGSGGKGNIDLGGRGKGTTRVVPGKTIIQGSLSREEIGRVIRAHLNRFKYCYEKQLNANPNLSGKISVYFTIAPNGAVASASVRETSMNDRNVEECALTVMRSLKFPQPRGGGVVVVTYPFVFNSA